MATSTIPVSYSDEFYYPTSSGVSIFKRGNTAYGAFIIMGFLQGSGPICVALSISGGAIASTINLLTGATYSNTHVTFTYSSGYLTITTDNSSASTMRVISG